MPTLRIFETAIEENKTGQFFWVVNVQQLIRWNADIKCTSEKKVVPVRWLGWYLGQRQGMAKD